MRLFSGVLGSLSVCQVLAGCRPSEPIPLSPSGPSIRRASGLKVQSTPEFIQAEERFRAGDKHGALSILNGLAARGDLSGPEQEYVVRQKSIVEGRHKTAGIPGSVKSDLAASSHPARDCGPRALLLALRALGVRPDLRKLTDLSGDIERGTNLAGLRRAAAAYGISATGIQMDSAALRELGNPAVAWVNGDHFIAVLKVEGDAVTVRDPNTEREEVMKTDELIRRSGGILLSLAK